MSTYIDFAEIKETVAIDTVFPFLDLEMKQNGEQHRGVCPVCGGGDRSLVVTPSKGVFYCFTSRKGGDVIALVSHVREIGMKESATLLADRNDTVPDNSKVPGKGTVPKEKGIKPLSYLQADHEKLECLEVFPETMEHFEAGYASKGIMRGKFAIPVHNRVGTLMAYAGRALDSKHLVFPNGFKPEEYIFNAQNVTGDELYLTRDPLEVLLAYQNGVENVVSFLTDTIAPMQLEILASLMDVRGCPSVELF